MKPMFIVINRFCVKRRVLADPPIRLSLLDKSISPPSSIFYRKHQNIKISTL